MTDSGPIICKSKMIPAVLSSVAEAELAGAFHAAQAAVPLRCTLRDLGYPQPATTLQIDNTVAIQLANASINAKRSKAMDMRFFWIVDRIRQGQFKTLHVPGVWNIADFFTKALPKQKFYQFLAYLATNLDNEDLEVKLKCKIVTFLKEM